MYPKWLKKVLWWFVSPRVRPALYPKLIADIIRWALIIAATIFSIKWLWQVYWIIGLVFAFPVYWFFLNLFGFLTLPLYDYTTEAQNLRNTLEKFKDDYGKNNK